MSNFRTGVAEQANPGIEWCFAGHVINSLDEILKPTSQREKSSIVGATANAPTDA
jgi:hypothetical protein